MASASQAIQQQLAQLAQQLQLDQQVQQQYGAVGNQRIGESYNELGGKLQGSLRDLTSLFGQSGKEITGSYNEANRNVARSQNFVNQLFGDNEIAGQTSRANHSQMLADLAAGKAGSVSAHNLERTGDLGAARVAIGDAAREGTSAKRDLQGQVQANMFDLQQNYGKERNDMQARLQEVLAQEEAARRQEALEREALAIERAKAAEARRQFDIANALEQQKQQKANPLAGREGVLRYAKEAGLKSDQDKVLFQLIRSVESDPLVSVVGSDPSAVLKDRISKLKLKGKYAEQYRNRLDLMGDIYYGRYQP